MITRAMAMLRGLRPSIEALRTAIRGVTVVVISLAVAACGGGDDAIDNSLVVVHNEDFSASAELKWLHYPDIEPIECRPLERSMDPDGTDFATSRGPWWTDTNHAPPGLGYLHLVALAYHRDWSPDGLIPDASTGAKPLDLRNAEVTIRWRAPQLHLPGDAMLTLWFQTRTSPANAPAPRFVNYLLTGQTLGATPPPAQWREDVVHLRSSENDYACLGSNVDRADTYGCDVTAVEALRDWNADLGLVVFFRDPASAREITGAVDLDRVTIRIPEENLATHGLAAPSIVTAGGSTCRST